MRSMKFPRRVPWLIALILLPFWGVLFLPLGLCYWLAYPPVQHYYLGAYFESAFVGDHSTVAVPVQWLYKTAPGKKRAAQPNLFWRRNRRARTRMTLSAKNGVFWTRKRN